MSHRWSEAMNPADPACGAEDHAFYGPERPQRGTWSCISSSSIVVNFVSSSTKTICPVSSISFRSFLFFRISRLLFNARWTSYFVQRFLPVGCPPVPESIVSIDVLCASVYWCEDAGYTSVRRFCLVTSPSCWSSLFPLLGGSSSRLSSGTCWAALTLSRVHSGLYKMHVRCSLVVLRTVDPEDRLHFCSPSLFFSRCFFLRSSPHAGISYAVV